MAKNRKEGKRESPIRLDDLLPPDNVKGGGAKPKTLFGAIRKSPETTTDK